MASDGYCRGYVSFAHFLLYLLWRTGGESVHLIITGHYRTPQDTFLSLNYTNESGCSMKKYQRNNIYPISYMQWLGRSVSLVPGLLGPKPFRPGTPWPKSIFLLGLLGLGLLGPVIKILYLWHTMENKCISSVCFISILDLAL